MMTGRLGAATMLEFGLTGTCFAPSPSCNWATRLWPHSCVWKELLGLAGSLERVKGAGGGLGSHMLSAFLGTYVV